MNVHSFKNLFHIDRLPQNAGATRYSPLILTLIFNMRMTTKTGLAAALLFLASCSDKDKDDVIDEVDRAGAVETAVSVLHADSTHDVLMTTHKVWVNHQEFKTVVHLDTIPALGVEHTTAENSDGDTKDVNVKKDYEIYITVK